MSDFERYKCSTLGDPERSLNDNATDAPKSAPRRGFLAAQRRGGRGRVVGPAVARIAAAHLLGDRCPAAAPETRQVLRALDRSARRRGKGKDERNLAAGDGRVLGQTEQR